MKNIVVDSSQLTIGVKGKKAKNKLKKGLLLFDNLFKAQFENSKKNKMSVSTFFSKKSNIFSNKTFLITSLPKEEIPINKNLYQNIAKNEYTKSKIEQKTKQTENIINSKIKKHVENEKKPANLKNIKIIYPQKDTKIDNLIEPLKQIKQKQKTPLTHLQQINLSKNQNLESKEKHINSKLKGYIKPKNNFNSLKNQLRQVNINNKNLNLSWNTEGKHNQTDTDISTQTNLYFYKDNKITLISSQKNSYKELNIKIQTITQKGKPLRFYQFNVSTQNETEKGTKTIKPNIKETDNKINNKLEKTHKQKLAYILFEKVGKAQKKDKIKAYLLQQTYDKTQPKHQQEKPFKNIDTFKDYKIQHKPTLKENHKEKKIKADENKILESKSNNTQFSNTQNMQTFVVEIKQNFETNPTDNIKNQNLKQNEASKNFQIFEDMKITKPKINKATNKQPENQIDLNTIKPLENTKSFETQLENLHNQTNVSNTHIDNKLSKPNNIEINKQNFININQNRETDINNIAKQDIQVYQTIISSTPINFKKHYKHKMHNIKIEKTTVSKKEVKSDKTFTFENIENAKVLVKLENNSQILNKNNQQIEDISHSVFTNKTLIKQENMENAQTEEQQTIEFIENLETKELTESLENKEYLKQANLKLTIEKIENMKKLATKHISLKIVSNDLVLRANLTNQKLNISMLINEGIYDTFYNDVENIIKETGFEEYSLKIKTQKEVKSFRKTKDSINIRA